MSIYWIKYRGTRFPLRRGEMVIGRSAYAAIVVNHQAASREHCVLRLTQDGLFVADLGSRNGTFVNGELISEARLMAGDVVRIGGDTIEILEGGEPREQARLNTPSVAFDEQEPTTSDQGGIIDLVETFVAAGKDALPIETAAVAIELLFGQLRAQARTNQRGVSESTKRRLLDVATRYARWFPDGSRDAWLAELDADLEKAKRS